MTIADVKSTIEKYYGWALQLIGQILIVMLEHGILQKKN